MRNEFMSSPRRHHFKKRDRNRHQERPGRPQAMHELVNPEHTGSESGYLKSLVDSQMKVTVVLKTGEHLRGHIRYYDRYCFSIGLSADGPRLFLRKSSVSYIAEE